MDRRSAPWRSGYAAACKAVYTGSIPVGALPRDSAPMHAIQVVRPGRSVSSPGDRHRFSTLPPLDTQPTLFQESTGSGRLEDPRFLKEQLLTYIGNKRALL